MQPNLTTNAVLLFATVATTALAEVPNPRPAPAVETTPTALNVEAPAPSTTMGPAVNGLPPAAVGSATVESPAAVPPPILPAIEAAPAGARSDAKISPEAPLETGPTAVKGKWNPLFYGFVEFDAIHDSTQSFNDTAGNASIQNPNGYAGKHGRTQFGVRNSRLGFKLSAPAMDGLRISGILEMDFLGNQPATPPAANISENAYYSSPTFRLRHYAMKIENPYVDVLVGQYWQLFGWQTYFHPATVEIQGVPGELFARAPQVRLSHVFKTDALDLELAAAASKPPQRDSEVPDGQAGLRLLINPWKGVHTMGGASTVEDRAAIGVSGVSRRFSVPEFSASPVTQHSTSGWGLSVDALLPIIAAKLDDRGNALTLNGSFVTGRGIADLYTGLTAGATASWALPNPSGVANPTYVPDIDSGLVEFDASGRLHAIAWQGFLGGIQYYLPPNGHLWLALNYSHMKSSNVLDYVADASRNNIFFKTEWYDANLFWDATVATRFGIEYARFNQTYADNSTRHDDRGQFSGWLLF